MEKQVQEENKIRRLITSLNDPSIDIRHQAVRTLGEIGEPATGPLIQALADAENDDHRWYAAVALSGIGEQQTPLISAMRVHHEKEFRRFAAAALGNIGIPAVEPIIDAMADDDREMRGYLSLALCRIGKPAVEPLARRLDDADEIITSWRDSYSLADGRNRASLNGR